MLSIPSHSSLEVVYFTVLVSVRLTTILLSWYRGPCFLLCSICCHSFRESLQRHLLWFLTVDFDLMVLLLLVMYGNTVRFENDLDEHAG